MYHRLRKEKDAGRKKCEYWRNTRETGDELRLGPIQITHTRQACSAGTWTIQACGGQNMVRIIEARHCGLLASNLLTINIIRDD